jgi:myotubularin-related protein 1/2
LIFPIGLGDDAKAVLTAADLSQAAAFRVKGRLPVLTWYNARTGNALGRCAYPRAAATGTSSGKIASTPAAAVQAAAAAKSSAAADELVFRAFRNTCTSGQLTLIDLRVGAPAEWNVVKYEGVKVQSFEMSSLAALRNAYDGLRDAASWLPTASHHSSSPSSLSHNNNNNLETDAVWLGATHRWLTQVGQVLHASAQVATHLDHGSSVIVQCPEGSDRSTQICALAQLMLDPYHRTIQGHHFYSI